MPIDTVLEETLSPARFERYLDWAAQDRHHALNLYTLNAQLSECLYLPLQMLEVALRNRINAVLSEAIHPGWMHDPACLLGDRQAEQREHALRDLARENKEPSPANMVAALTFSFWTAMLGTRYETLWQQGLYKIAMTSEGKRLRRKDFSGPLTAIRLLRNRIAHHEPIVMWNLREHHSKMLELIGYLSPPALAWCQTYERFHAVYPQDGIILSTPDSI